MALAPPSTSRKPPKNRGSDALAALLARGRPLVMGILNVTPDSFSDGGRFLDPARAIAHAERDGRAGRRHPRHRRGIDAALWRRKPVAAAEEKARLARGAAGGRQARPAGVDRHHQGGDRRLGARCRARQSSTTSGACNAIPTWRRSSPRAACRSSSCTTATTADPAIDIIADVNAFFARSLEIAARAGIARDKIVLDPGIGFGKTPEQSIACIARLAEFKRFGLPLLVGASRKRFINAVTPAPPDERIGGSIAAHLLAVENGAAIVRVHDVAETVQALRVPRPSRRHDERPHLHQRAVAARLSRRHGATRPRSGRPSPSISI